MLIIILCFLSISVGILFGWILRVQMEKANKETKERKK